MSARGVVVLAAMAMAAQAPPLDPILVLAGRYVDDYQRSFSAVVSEEHYSQSYVGAGARNGTERRILRSDVLLVHERYAGWVTFRDVYEVDGIKVRDREDRLVRLILNPASSPHEQVQRIADESARFNLGPGSRTMNTPTLPLAFLSTAGQTHSEFRLARMSKVDGRTVAEVEFIERGKPRLVKTQDDAPATGRYWIEPATGQVLKTELSIRSLGVQATIAVTYRMQEKIGMLAPVTMTESYDYGNSLRSGASGGVRDIDTPASASFRIEGHATYTNLRSFSVNTSTIIRK